MRLCYRRGGKGAAPEGFDRVYTEVDGEGNVLRELLAYVRAGDEARTRYLHLGKVALYQMSYARGTRCTIPDIFRFVKHRF